MYHEPHLHVVTYNKPKLLTGLNQNGKWLAAPLGKLGSTRTSKPLAEQRDLNYPLPFRAQMNYAERGKPVFSPQGKANRKERPWECGQG